MSGMVRIILLVLTGMALGFALAYCGLPPQVVYKAIPISAPCDQPPESL